MQFRNLATIGGSVYSRFGFSDVICALMSLKCEVILYRGGAMDIESFVNSDYQRDIITHIVIYKDHAKRAFACMRKSATDISVLNISICEDNDHYICNVGARPQKAKRYVIKKEEPHLAAAKLKAMVECGSNMRAKKEYRQALAEALCIKALKKMEEESA